MENELNPVCESPKLNRVIRLDSVPVQKADFTEEGYLVDKPILTTTGIFEYTNSDGSTRRELRLPSEVFDEESLKSYKGKPIVITHDAGLITKENVGKEMIGTILSDGYRDKDSVRAEIVIHNTDEMKESGLKELSLGYNLELDETPGVWNGQHYDAVQRNIRINHLALVREARAGDNARLNIDSRDNNTLKGGIVMTASKKRKHTARADGILSEAELEKAIEEYKKNHPKKDAKEPEDVEEEDIVETVEEDSHDDKIPSYEKGDLTSKINKCLLNRDERDDKGDPKDLEGAMEYIADQDEDIQTLFDIIDTLLAEKDFGSDKKEDSKCDAAKDEDEDIDIDIDIPDDDEDEENDDAKDEEEEEEDVIEVDPSGKEVEEDGEYKEEDVVPDTDIPDDDDENEDADDDEELIDFEDEEVEEDGDDDDKDVDIDIDIPDDDEDDDEEEEDGDDEDEDDEEIEVEDLFKKHKGVNADSVDAIVRTRVKIGMVGRSLNMDGLENKDIRDAMRAIIRKVRPTMRLDGKSDTYIKAAFDMACDEVKTNEKAPKGVDYQRRQMYNRKTVRTDSDDNGGGAEAARKRMIKNMNIKKEDK